MRTHGRLEARVEVGLVLLVHRVPLWWRRARVKRMHRTARPEMRLLVARLRLREVLVALWP